VELTILAQSLQGLISRYSIRLVDIFENLQSTPLQLKYTWTGHHSDIKTIVKYPWTDCFISLGRDGEAILWDITKPEISQVFFIHYYYLEDYNF
jgi:hypothetical protein